MDKPLPCIVCGMQPEQVFRDSDYRWQPYGATMFSAAGGHYGSTVWDEIHDSYPVRRSLRVNVCDKCLVDRKDRVAVQHETVHEERTVEWFPWEGPWKPDS